MRTVAPTFRTADMVRAQPDDGRRYETVHGELLGEGVLCGRGRGTACRGSAGSANSDYGRVPARAGPFA